MVMEKPVTVKRKRGRPKTILRTEPKPILPLFPKVPFEPVLVTPLHILSQQHVEQQPNKQVLSITLQQNDQTVENELADKAPVSSKESASRNATEITEKNGKTCSGFRRCSHNAEEKRRKARINQWITKLGELVCKERDERKSKNAILEHVFNYVREKMRVNVEEGHQWRDDAVMQLTVRIKHLESLVVLLIQLLKQHSISVPDCVNVKNYTFPDGVSPLTEYASQKKRLDNYDDTQTHFQIDTSTYDTQQQNIATVTSVFLDTQPSVLDSHENTSDVKDLSREVTLSQPTQPLKGNLLSNTQDSNEITSFSANQIKVNDLWRPIESLLSKPTLPCESTELPDKDLTKVTYVVTPSMTLYADAKETVSDNKDAQLSTSNSTMTHAIVNSDNDKHTMGSTQPSMSSYDVTCNAMTTDTSSPTLDRFLSNVQAAETTSYLLNSPRTAGKTQPVVVQEESVRSCLQESAVITNKRTQQAVVSSSTSSINTTKQSCRSTVATTKMTMTNIQSFGIDNILVHQDITSSTEFEGVVPVSRYHSGPSVTMARPKRICQVSRHKKQKSKVVSQPVVSSSSKDISACKPKATSGHTVAALLENIDHSLALVKKSENNPTRDGTLTCSSQQNTGPVFTSTKTTVTSSSNVNTTKRWGNVVANVQNNDMLLTSFVLRSNGSRRKRLVAKLTKRKISYCRQPKEGRGKDTVKTKETSGNLLARSIISVTPHTSVKCCSAPAKGSSSAGDSSTAATTMAVPPLPTTIEFSCVSATSTVTLSSVSFYTSESAHERAPFSTIGQTPNRCVTTDLNSRTMTENLVNVPSTSANQKSRTNSTIRNIEGKTPPGQLTLNNKTDMRHKSTVRTMKDRTIKNKWLEMGTCQEEPSVSVTTPCVEIANDQCASPVISYPNFKRKRGSTFDQGNVLEPKRKSQPNVVSTPSSNKDGVSVERTKSTFSAESLCQSDRKRSDKKNVKSDVRMCKSKLKTKQQMQQQHPTQSQTFSSIPTRKLNHQPTYPATLPTILNIFAPAPVPTSNIQQANMPSGLSNFSAETLINNSCQMNMMDNNMQNYSNNMILPSNFTNFSADTLISESDSSVTYAVNNLIGQNNPNHVSNYWNQSWLTPDMTYNESLFNISNLQNNIQRNRNQIPSTECSPIKSIMSILQSPNPNHSNMDLGNFLNSMSRCNQRQKRQLGGNDPQNIWYNNNSNNNIKAQQPANLASKVNFQQSSDMMFNFQSFQQNSNNYMNNMKPTGQSGGGGVSGETQIQPRVNAGHVLPFQQFSLGEDNRTTRCKQGPTFGNYPLVNL